MRYTTLLVCLAAIATALPEPVPVQADTVPRADTGKEEKREPLPFDDMPILDSLIDAHEKEGRTVNLSPQNNPRDGLLPRQCNSHSTCPCASGAATGLWCGYCVRPLDGVPGCNGQGNPCLDWVYQCGPGRDCCTFGRRTSCANRQGPCGPSCPSGC